MSGNENGMRKLLVTGASGFLGWNFCQQATATWEVYGTYCTTRIDQSSVRLLQVNLTDFRQLQDLFHQVQPDGVVHLAALSSPNLCETQPEVSYAMNVTVAVNVAGLCSDYGIPCVFTSTDLVFDGQHAPYCETDPVSPLSRYGEQKAIAEVEMLNRYPATALCRMPLMFGAVPPTASSFLQPFIKTLRDGQELRLFTDEFRTPVSAVTAAQGLLLALATVQGRIHLGGTERISRYEFGRLMVETLNLPAQGLKACRQRDVPMAAARPPDTSLDSSQAFQLGYAPRSLRVELADLNGKV